MKSDAGRVATLPKWAQEHVADIERERDVAIKELNRSLDDQTPSAFRVEDLVCTGENNKSGPLKKTRYIQAHSLIVEHMGVHLDVVLHNEGIDLNWSDQKQILNVVAFVPTSYQQARLVAVEE